jgi:hypothetical protein
MARSSAPSNKADKAKTLKGSGMNNSDFDKHFGKIHARHSGALNRYMIECRKACDGDLDLFLIMAIVGERTFTATHAPDTMSHEDFVSGTVGNIDPLPINLQSIADFSGIPRETVRRKLELLIARGWITRGENGYVTATDMANHALQGLTQSTLRYLADLKAVFEQMA